MYHTVKYKAGFIQLKSDNGKSKEVIYYQIKTPGNTGYSVFPAKSLRDAKSKITQQMNKYPSFYAKKNPAKRKRIASNQSGFTKLYNLAHKLLNITDPKREDERAGDRLDRIYMKHDLKAMKRFIVDLKNDIYTQHISKKRNPASIVSGATITTKVIPATNTKPTRVMAHANGRPKNKAYTVVVSADHYNEYQDAHVDAANKLANKLKWHGKWQGGQTDKGFTFICTKKKDISMELSTEQNPAKRKNGTCDGCGKAITDKADFVYMGERFGKIRLHKKCAKTYRAHVSSFGKYYRHKKTN